MCGEKFFVQSDFWDYIGSPPHVRGKGNGIALPTALYGITPACAGKRHFQAKNLLLRSDHPRMCGEKPVQGNFIALDEGSPPHVRGKVRKFTHLGCMMRITPACAGKSTGITDNSAYNWDHPRMCGEKPSSIEFSSFDEGSPPHVRGKVEPAFFINNDIGITPACAGKRNLLFPLILTERDHPRMCGEKVHGRKDYA